MFHRCAHDRERGIQGITDDGRLFFAVVRFHPDLEGQRCSLLVTDIETVPELQAFSFAQAEARLLSLNRLLTNESIAWAVNKEDAQLLLIVNLILKDLKEERAFSEVLSRYLPEIPTASQ